MHDRDCLGCPNWSATPSLARVCPLPPLSPAVMHPLLPTPHLPEADSRQSRGLCGPRAPGGARWEEGQCCGGAGPWVEACSSHPFPAGRAAQRQLLLGDSAGLVRRLCQLGAE